MNTVEARPAEVTPATEPPVFTVRDLSMRYGNSLALKDVNMDIRPRRITAIIGPSGCGKGTLIRCFNRISVEGAFQTAGRTSPYLSSPGP